MDWRAGNRHQPTGSAFRGMGTRGRGRGRGLGTPHNNRGLFGVPIASSQSIVVPEVSIPPLPPTPGYRTNAPGEIPLQGKQHSCKRAAHVPHSSSSPNHVDSHKVTDSSEQAATASRRPRTPRQVQSHNPMSPTSPDTPTNSPITPKASRSKPSRKRSHNRNRSSSKASITPALVVPGSLASLNEKDHSFNTGLHNNVPEDTKTDIDALVERVRAMAMAGSALEREKGKDKNRLGRYTPNEGHLDWAGDLDDSLPNLDDWVKPKLTQEDSELDVSLGPFSRSEMSAIAVNNKTDNHTSSISIEPNPIMENVTNGIPSAITREVSASSIKRTRNRHSKRRLTGGESAPPNTGGLKAFQLISPPLDVGSDARVGHPLPPKPNDCWNTVPIASEHSSNTHEIHPPNDNGVHFSYRSGQNHLDVPQNVSMGSNKESANDTVVDKTDPLEPMSAVGAAVLGHEHSPVTPLTSIKVDADSVSSTMPVVVGTDTEDRRNGEKVESIDSFKLLLPSSASPRSESPHRDHARSRDSFALIPPNQQHTRSHMNSPERKFRNVHRDGTFTHHRARSSPQTGPGTRMHASRPIISGDAISMISRTLVVASAGTSPRKRSMELTAEHTKEP